MQWDARTMEERHENETKDALTRHEKQVKEN